MIRFNGFNICILQNKVIATQEGVSFEFESLEKAIETIMNLTE